MALGLIGFGLVMAILLSLILNAHSQSSAKDQPVTVKNDTKVVQSSASASSGNLASRP